MRVVVADDSVLLREGVVRLLEEAGFDVVGQAGDADDLLRKVYAHKPDVAVVDVRMPPDHTDEGLRAALEIRGRQPETGVLVLSQYVEEGYALDLLADGAAAASATCSRTAWPTSSASSTRSGGWPAAARRSTPRWWLAAAGPHAAATTRSSELTPREREVLELMAEGRSNAAIAEQLVVTERAVEKHVTQHLRKLGLTPAADDHRRVLAVLAFLRAVRPVGRV